jgi:hypothetical protein
VGTESKSENLKATDHLRDLKADLRNYGYGDQIKKDEMGGARGIHRRDEKLLQNFGRET